MGGGAPNGQAWQILEALGEGVIGLDTAGRITFLNPAACELLRLDSREQAMGHDAHALLHDPHPTGETFPAERCPILRVIDTGDPLRGWEDWVWRMDRTPMPVRVYATPLYGADGACDGIAVSFQDRSDRHELEQDLSRQKEALERERALFIGGPTVVFEWRMEPGWPASYVSPNVTEVLGYTPEQLQRGDPVFADLIHPEDLPRVAGEVEHHRERGSTCFEHAPYRLLRADGAYRWFHDFTVIYRHRGGPDYHAGYLIDITERKEAELALARSERRYRMAQAAAQFGIWDWDLGADTIHWDADCWHLLGHDALSTELTLGYGELLERVHPDDRNHLESVVHERLLSQRDASFSAEIRLHRADGGWQWVHSRGQVVERDDGGSPRRVMGVHVDISELKAAQGSPRPHEARYQRFLDDFIGIAYQTRLDDRSPLLLRGMVEGITGYTQAQFLSGEITWPELVYPEDRAALTDPGPSADGASEIIDRQYRIRHRDGSLRWVRDIGREVTLSDRSTRVVQGAIYDITEQRRAEQVRDTFLAAVSHDLRTPLSSLLGFLELIPDDDLDATRQTYLRHCRESGERLSDLIDSLLDLSRLRAGGLTLRTEPLDLPEFLRAHLEPLTYTARDKGLTLSWAADPALPEWVDGDRTRLGQILTNLVVNAVKYTEAGGVTVSAEPAGAEHVRFTVTDTGPGIPESAREAIFETFNRGPEAERLPDGSGLGLAICRQLARMMDGDVELGNESSGGASFSFTARLPPASAPTAQPCAEDAEGAASPPGAGLTVVLAEDDATNQLLLRTLLERNGCTVHAAEDGASALDLWQRTGPDLMVMDLQMPRLDGHEAAATVRRREAEHGISPTPILLLTAHAREGARQYARHGGCDGLLTKPVDTRALERAIAAVRAGRPPCV